MEEQALIGKHLGEYEIQGLVAAGGRNTIYEAYQPVLKRKVALRTLNALLRSNPYNLEAFNQEVELFAKLEHPHIVPIYDFGVEDEYHYMVYRLLKGGSLKDKLESSPLPLREVVKVTEQLASALDYVHSQEIATGEIKRANILFDAWGNPYIVNLFYTQVRRLGKGEDIASRYMAPERWKGAAATPQSDQYAFAVIVYLMLTGVRPFPGTDTELESQHTNDFPLSVQNYRPDIPLVVNDVLLRALAKKPEDRYPTVMDFAREFEKALQAVPQHVFISYSRRDKDYARQFADYLSGNGFNVWIDDQIDYGDAWFKEIDGAVKSCAAFALLMSPDAEQSEWVHKEILLAKRYKKAIFPLLLSGEEFPIVIDIQFANVKDGAMPDTDFHRRLRRAVFGEG